MECDESGGKNTEVKRAACPFCDPPVELIVMCHACRWTHVPDTPAARKLMETAAAGREPLPEPDGRDAVPSGALFTGTFRCSGCHNLVGCLCPRCHRNVHLNSSVVSTCAQAVKRRRRNTDTKANLLYSTPGGPVR